ncbi:hypothetical protein ACFQ61_10375 [Streptomyces sp. NPDC056500]|uniref:hypothetical protein n=1 Tax=Streptomyces sp. NPDC056500 TaxID=3345840 RepID=UPI0036CF1CAB
MALDPTLLVARLFEQIAAEDFDFTVTASDREDESRWLQLRGNSINLPYPYADEPQGVLSAFDVFGSVSWSVESWQPNGYVTIDWGPPATGPLLLNDNDNNYNDNYNNEYGDEQDEKAMLATVVGRLATNYLRLPIDSGRWTVKEG